MDPQPALGAAASRHACGIRDRTAVPDFAWSQAADRQFPRRQGKGNFRACARRRTRRSQARADTDGVRIARQKSGGRGRACDLDREHMMEASMLSPDRVAELTPLTAAASDYEIVRRAIG